MSQSTNDPSGIRANPPPKLETGFTTEAPAPAAGVRRRMRWVRLMFIGLAGAAVVGVVVVAATDYLKRLVCGIPTTPMTVEQADRLASSGPPAGATLEEVETWLTSQGITATSQGPSYEVFRRSDFPSSDDWMDGGGNQTVAECAGLKTEDVHSFVRVIYPDADRHLMARDRITIYFFFDDKDRLLKHWVDVFHITF